MSAPHRSTRDTSHSPWMDGLELRSSDVTFDFFSLVAFQLLVCWMVSPGDGGRWFLYTASLFICFDVAVYFVFIAGGRTRRTRLSILTTTLIAGSLAIAATVTLVVERLGLP